MALTRFSMLPSELGPSLLGQASILNNPVLVLLYYRLTSCYFCFATGVAQATIWGGGLRVFAYVWPLALVVVSNIFYQICAKSVPNGINPLASLVVTYTVGALSSLLLYFALNKDVNLLREFGHLNWAPFMLGVAVVGLEVGFIYAYKAGWQVSTASIVQSAFLAVALIGVGYVLYHEALTFNKLIGIAICLVGLVFINK